MAKNLANREIDQENVRRALAVDDFASLALNFNDTSFSDVNSDDSSGWMHMIDVSNFKKLTCGLNHTETDSYTPNSVLSSSRSNHNTNGSGGKSSCFQRNFSEPCMKRVKVENCADPPAHVLFDHGAMSAASPAVKFAYSTSVANTTGYCTSSFGQHNEFDCSLRSFSQSNQCEAYQQVQVQLRWCFE